MSSTRTYGFPVLTIKQIEYRRGILNIFLIPPALKPSIGQDASPRLDADKSLSAISQEESKKEDYVFEHSPPSM